MDSLAGRLLRLHPDQPRQVPWITGFRRHPAVLIERPRGGAWVLERRDGTSLRVADGRTVVVPAECDHCLRMLAGPPMRSSWALVRWGWAPGVELTVPRAPLVLPPTAGDPLADLAAVAGSALVDQIARQRILLDLLATLLAHDGGEGRAPRGIDRRLHPVLHYLEEQLDDPELDRAALAAVAGLSESRFHEIFLRAFDRSPMRYVAEQRLRRARTLLASGELSMGLIAERCGYASPFYFSRAFKRALGCTPSAYRERHRMD